MSQELKINQKYVTEAEAVEITDAESMSKATTLLSSINKYGDEAKAEKDKVMRPILDAAKAERERWKPLEDMVKVAVKSIKDKMGAYQTAEVAKAEKAKEAIISRVGQGSGKLKLDTAAKKINAVCTPETSVKTEAGGVTFKTDYEVEVTDLYDIPSEYLEVNINAIKKAHKDGKEVPGVQIKEVQVPVNRR